MISGYIDNEQFHNAIKLFHDPKYRLISKNMITHTAVIKAYCEAKDMTAAKKIFDVMTHKDTYTLNTMITGYIDNQQFEEAIQLYNDQKYSHISKDTITHSTAIKAYCEKGDTITARNIYNKMTNMDVFTLCTMIKGYINNQQFKDAIQLYEQNNEITKDIVTHNAAMEAYCKLGLFKQSQEIFHRFKNIASIGEWETKSLLFFNTALMCWELQYLNTVNLTIIQTMFNDFVPSMYKPQLKRYQTIDLHGFPCFIAKYSIIEHLLYLKPKQPLTIITGIGKHLLNDPKLPQMVQQLLQQMKDRYSWYVTENPGVESMLLFFFN